MWRSQAASAGEGTLEKAAQRLRFSPQQLQAALGEAPSWEKLEEEVGNEPPHHSRQDIGQLDRLLPDYNTVGSASKTIHFLHRYLVNLVINLSQREKQDTL